MSVNTQIRSYGKFWFKSDIGVDSEIVERKA